MIWDGSDWLKYKRHNHIWISTQNLFEFAIGSIYHNNDNYNWNHLASTTQEYMRFFNAEY